MNKIRKRRAVYIRSDLHAIALERYERDNVEIQRTIDDCLECGMRIKRLIPSSEGKARETQEA